jgi:hypothetical protein
MNDILLKKSVFFSLKEIISELILHKNMKAIDKSSRCHKVIKGLLEYTDLRHIYMFSLLTPLLVIVP